MPLLSLSLRTDHLTFSVPASATNFCNFSLSIPCCLTHSFTVLSLPPIICSALLIFIRFLPLDPHPIPSSPPLLQAMLMVDRAEATVTDIDLSMQLGAGHPMGPLHLADYIGNLRPNRNPDPYQYCISIIFIVTSDFILLPYLILSFVSRTLYLIFPFLVSFT